MRLTTYFRIFLRFTTKRITLCYRAILGQLELKEDIKGLYTQTS